MIVLTSSVAIIGHKANSTESVAYVFLQIQGQHEVIDLPVDVSLLQEVLNHKGPLTLELKTQGAG